MELTFYPGEWPEAEVVASPSEYAAMAACVAELARVEAGEVVFPAAGPGLSALAVRIGSGPAVVAILGGTLSVSGGPEAVGLLGQNMPADQSLPSRYHIHYEHSTRPEYVAAESIPLVLMVASGQNAEPAAADVAMKVKPRLRDDGR